MNSTIDDIKARLDIVEVVSGYVSDLKQSGRTWKACCPFHQERTPSFTVDPARGTWHCFGACSTGGDVLSFIQRVERLDFRDALRLAAERAGVELAPPSPRQRELSEAHERLLAANEAATTYYRSHLEGAGGEEALRYAEGRGLDRAARERWELGYAPDEWSGLTDHLLARGFAEQDLLDAGLAVRGDRGLYDRFRGRLIFPTRDQRGRLIGFGARALTPEQEPKYLNTSQTSLFDKSGTLYGLDHAAEAARRADRIVVVEGYMDVIACHQFGFEHVVASMGTAVTEKQMRLIQRFTSNVVLALDADQAGSEATLRGVAVAADASEREATATLDWRGLVSYEDTLRADIRVVALPDGEDPDSLVRSDPERFRALLEQAQPVADHLFGAIEAQTDANDPRQRSRAVEALAPTVAAMADPVVRSHYLQRLARLARVDERTVEQLVARAGVQRGESAQRGPVPVASPREVRRAANQPAAAPDGEVQLLQLLLRRDHAVRDAAAVLDADLFEDALHRALFEAWCAGPLEGEALEELDEPLRERALELTSNAPEWLGVDLLPAAAAAEAATDMARVLRLRRRHAALQPVVVAQAAERAEQRRRGERDTSSDEEFAVLVERQRALSREYRGAVSAVGAKAGAAEDGAREGVDNDIDSTAIAVATVVDDNEDTSGRGAAKADADPDWEDL